MIVETKEQYDAAFERITADLDTQIKAGRRLVHSTFGECAITPNLRKYELLSDCGCVVTLCTVDLPMSEDTFELISQEIGKQEHEDYEPADSPPTGDYLLIDFGLHYGIQWPLEFINGFDGYQVSSQATRNSVEKDCFALGKRVREWAENLQVVFAPPPELA